jgi:hypothetical protein
MAYNLKIKGSSITVRICKKKEDAGENRTPITIV